MKKYNGFTIALIILLVIRLIGQGANAFWMLNDPVFFAAYSFFGLIYLICLIGVIAKKKWGSVLTVVIAVVDILFSLTMGGAAALGAGIMDLLLMSLGYKEYKQVIAFNK